MQIQLIAQACSDAYCPIMENQKPKLCTISREQRTSNQKIQDWTEFHLRTLIKPLALNDDPILLTKIAGILAGLGAFQIHEVPKETNKINAPKQIDIKIKANGNYLVDRYEILNQDLKATLTKNYPHVSKDILVVIHADKIVPYRLVVTTLDAIQAVGFRNVVFGKNKK